MTLRLPEDPESERALLSTLGAAGTLDPGTDNLDAIRAVLAILPEQMAVPAHRSILQAIQALYHAGEPLGSLSIRAKLESLGALGRVGGYSGLVEILGAEEVGMPSRVVARLLDLWRQRQVILLSGKASELAATPTEPIQEVISRLAGLLSILAAGSSTSAKIRKGSAMVDRIVAGEAFRDQDFGEKLCWFGLEAFDGALECSPGHVVMIGARPGVGKSALAIQAFMTTARNGGRPFLVSLEMDDGEIDSRLASWQSGEGYKAFRSGHWTDVSARSIIGAAEVLDHTSIWCHTSGVPWPTVEAAIRDAVRINGATCVIIDHILLVEKPNLGKGSNDAACWTSLSRSIKKLAGELKICIVPLCQLNRQGAEGEPKLSDFRDSGGWEEDAVAVIMLWQKDANASEEVVETRAIYGKFAKNRSGSSGWKRELAFQGACNRFNEVVHNTEESECVPPGVPTRSAFWGNQPG